MTIDERIERLTERHEAISQAVEVMGQITGQRINEVISAINKDAENIRALARIAEIHERRLTDIEGGRA